MFDYIYDEKAIVQKRKQIFEEFLELSENVEDGNFKTISTYDLKLLFELYDKVFFHSDFRNQYEGSLRFSFSKRMTRSAGLTLCPQNISTLQPKDVIIEFRFGINFFFNYDLSHKEKFVSGVKTHNALEALQLVLEHEICHVIEFILYHRSSCKGKRFKTIAAVIMHYLQIERLLKKSWVYLLGKEYPFNLKMNPLKALLMELTSELQLW